MAYIETEQAIAEIDKGDLLVGNNAEWAKEIIRRTPTADVVPRAEVEKIFAEIDSTIELVCAMTGLNITIFGKFAELKKKYVGYKQRKEDEKNVQVDK